MDDTIAALAPAGAKGARLSREEIDQLADDIAVLAARIDAATHQLLEHIRRFDEAMGWAKQGAQSCAHLACDAGLVVAKTDERGDVFDIGRQRRTVNAAIKRALLIRDRHCRWPGCIHDAFVEAHHLEHWAQGGETKLEKMLLLCFRHHQMAHEGGFAIDGEAGGQLRFFDPDGRPIEAAPAPAIVESNPVEQLTDAPIDRRTSVPRWDGTPLDLHAAVGGLVWRHERAGLPL